MHGLTSALSSSSIGDRARANPLAIVASTIAAFVFASTYYSVFAEQWLAWRGLDPGSAAAVEPSPVAPFIEILRSLLMALVIARLVERLGITSWKVGLQLGGALWVAFPGMLWLGAIMWENTPWQLALLHGGDWLFKCLLMAVLPSVWRR